jgi:hypothetical protein
MLKNDLRGDLIAMVTITITYIHLLWVHMSGHIYTVYHHILIHLPCLLPLLLFQVTIINASHWDQSQTRVATHVAG